MKFILNTVRGVAALGALALTSITWRERKKRGVAAQPKEERYKGEPGALEVSVDLVAPVAAACITWLALGRIGKHFWGWAAR